MAGLAPTHRHRSKSAPRGRSPNPKQLKKVAKGLVTPPPKQSKADSSRSGSEKKPKAKLNRRLSFGPGSTTEIMAENPPGNSPYGGMKLSKATEILEALKKEQLGWETMGLKLDFTHRVFKTTLRIQLGDMYYININTNG